MKYNITTLIEKDQREALNDACYKQAVLRLTGDDQLLSKAHLFALYTGKGAISGIKWTDQSFSHFISEKRAVEQGQFFTGLNACETIVGILNVEAHASIFDPTCGHGSFANHVKEENFYGCEKDAEIATIGQYLFPKSNIENSDISNYNQSKRFDYLISNPPFNLEIGGKNAQSYILHKSVEWMKPYGFFAFIVPETYLSDEHYYSGDIKFINANLNFLGAYKMHNAFEAYDLKYPVKVLFFQNCQGREFDNSVMADHGDNHMDIRNEIEALKIDRKKYIVSTLSEDLNENDFSFKQGTVSNELAFSFAVKKLIYEIKTHKGNDSYQKAVGILNDFQNQQQPATMSTEEWLKIRLTKPKVLFRLKQLIGFKKKRKGDRFYTKTHPLQLTPLKEIKATDEILTYVNTVILKSHKGSNISPFDYQKEDLAKILSKPYNLLGHQQGLGKTITSFVWGEYSNRKKCVVFPKVVDKDWQSFLKANNKTFVVVKKLSDIKQDADYYVFTMELLARSVKKSSSKNVDTRNTFRQIKAYMKSFDFDVIIDECDNMNDYNSNTYKAIRNLFIKGKRKMLMSGTAIRNNIAEYWPLIDFLYNGTYVNNCKYVYSEIKVKGEPTKIKEFKNEKIGQSFRSYKGFTDFKKCFCPAKESVFGLNKQNQDVYNQEELIKMLNTILIVRKFKDIAADKYEIKHTLIDPTFEEKMLHEDILKETYKYISGYYGSTGNSRKDSALRIIRQLNLLIETTIHPERFKEYTGGVNTKLLKCIDICKKHADKKIAIGCTRLDVVDYYARHFRKQFDRPVFVHTGSLSKPQRVKLLKEYEQSDNGILICTQQSLKAGVNMGYVDIAIVQGLRWNMPAISQWYFRFIRIDQTNVTTVYFVNYTDTIESNLFALINAKDTIVNITEQRDDCSLVADGFDESILDTLLSYVFSDEGKVNVGWGKQKIQ